MAYGDDHQSLREITELVQENNKILRGLRRAHRWASFFSFIKWTIIIVSILASYYYLQPFVDQLKSSYESVVPTLGGAMNILRSLPTGSQNE